MKKSKISPNQITTVLKEFDAGKKQKTSVENLVLIKLHFTNGKIVMPE